MKLLKTIRLFPLVLSFIGALAMSTAPAVADDVTLKLWSGGFEKEGQRTIREVIGEFEAANAGIKIEYTAWAWDKYRAQLANAAILGDAPDMWVDSFLKRWKDAGITRDNADLYAKLPPEEVAAYLQATIEIQKASTGLLSFPFVGYVWAVGYNKEIFAERGIEVPTEPISLEQLKELSAQLTFDRDGDGKIDVYGYSLLGGRVSSHFFNMIFNKRGGQWVDLQGNLIIDQYRDQFIEALVFMREMAEYTPGGATAAVGRSYDGVRALFAQERVAITADVGELGSVLVNLAPEVGEKLGFLEADFGMYGFETLIIGKTDHRDEAFEFVKLVTARDQLVRLNDAAGTVTPRNDVADHPLVAANENEVILAEQLTLPGNAIHPGGLLTQYGELRPAVWNAVAEVLLGGDPGEAADKAIKKMTDQFSQ
jgi:multiple sugar transport system substrate-binding protein